MNSDNLYAGREQTLVKHFVLQKYLERFAHIVGSRWDVITYVDCFSGPWNVRSQDLKDSSFALALGELRKARQTLLSQKGRNLQLRCFFLEKEPAPYARLKEFADQVTDAEIVTLNRELESAVDEILTFAKSGGTSAFSFIFIDPKGWTGFEMSVISPLLRLAPGEVLINFMTGHIQRFIESPQEQTQESFIELFGSADFKERLLGLERQDREDAIVDAYAANVKAKGQFNYVCSAIVLHPQIDRTHFHLIYATRNLKGVEVFKDVEKKAMEVMEKARAEAQKRGRVGKSGQGELFESDVRSKSTRYDTLRERYLTQARDGILQLLKAQGQVLYDDIWKAALSKSLVWETDLKEWIRAWEKIGSLRIEGKRPKQRVPYRGKHNYLKWLGP